MPPWDSDWGHQCTQLTSILTQTSWTNINPDQISVNQHQYRATIISCRRRSMPWRRNQSQLTWALTEYLQQTSGIPWSVSCTNHLSQQTSRILMTLPTDALAVRFVFYQMTSVTPSNIANQLQGFWTRHSGSSRAVLNISSRCSSLLQHAHWKIFSLISSKYFLSVFSRLFMVMWLLHPLNVKINRHKVVLPFTCSYSDKPIWFTLEEST